MNIYYNLLNLKENHILPKYVITYVGEYANMHKLKLWARLKEPKIETQAALTEFQH